MRRRVVLLLVLSLGIALYVAGILSGPAPPAEDVYVIEWNTLVPADYDPDELVRKYSAEVARLKDDDPRGKELAETLRQAWEDAPVVTFLNDKVVKLSGFIVSLEGNGEALTEFLLVPYFGACIHTPPPPSNQIVFVRTPSRPFPISRSFERITVTGRLRTEHARSARASASYAIDATRIELASR
jgi:hypothetical protein